MSLEGSPADDTIVGLAKIWTEHLRRYEDWRLLAAFQRLETETKRWPALAMLVERLPPKPRDYFSAGATPAPQRELTEDEHRLADEGRARMAKMFGDVAARLGVSLLPTERSR